MIPRIEKIVMTAISGTTVFGPANITQIAFALKTLWFTNAASVSIEQAKDVIFKQCSVHLTEEQLASMRKQLAELRETRLNHLETTARAYLKRSYAVSEYATIRGVFGKPLELEGQYVNLQMLCRDLKTKKSEENKELKESAETAPKEKYQDARIASVEDLFGDKRAIKTEQLFKPLRKLLDNTEFEITKDANEIPRLILVQGRAGVGKTTFVHYVAHRWSQEKLYANYTWLFTLSLRQLRSDKFRLVSTELSLQEWIRQSQFGSFEQTEFNMLWEQRIEPAIHQNQVLLILDGYDETPDAHPCQSILQDLLTSGGRYPTLSLLVTTRPCSADDINKKRRNLEIIGFTDENIHQYIRTYFLDAPNKTLIDTVTKTLRKQSIIWANAHIPLNLNLLCGIMEKAIKKNQDKSLIQVITQLSSMTRLYQVMEKKLYGRSYSRFDTRPLKLGGKIIREKTDVIKHYQKARFFLATLAFESFQTMKDTIIIQSKLVRSTLQAYVDKEIAQDSQQDREKLGGEFFETVCTLGLIKPVLDTTGLSETKQDYEFLHLTFQEYYAAIYLAEGLSGQDITLKVASEKIILKEKYNPRWQIVWWFVAGLFRSNNR